MSREYDLYLKNHRDNVAKGFRWMEENLPDVIAKANEQEYEIPVDLEHQIVFSHDASKNKPDEYEAYDAYFYGGNRSYQVLQEYRRAWLVHIHRNPHHWQHWILINDDPNEGEITLDMPYEYIIEMICDWWAFSWAKENLFEIFKWYDEHKAYMKLSDRTRIEVEDILKRMKVKLEEENSGNSAK